MIFLNLFFVFYTKQWIFIVLSPKLHTLPLLPEEVFLTETMMSSVTWTWLLWTWCADTWVPSDKEQWQNISKAANKTDRGARCLPGKPIKSTAPEESSEHIRCESTAPHTGQAQKRQHIRKTGEISLMPFIHVGKADSLQKPRHRSCSHCVSNATKI